MPEMHRMGGPDRRGSAAAGTTAVEAAATAGARARPAADAGQVEGEQQQPDQHQRVEVEQVVGAQVGVEEVEQERKSENDSCGDRKHGDPPGGESLLACVYPPGHRRQTPPWSYPSALTAFATTRAAVTSAIADSSAMPILAPRLIGSVSVGLNAVALVKA